MEMSCLSKSLLSSLDVELIHLCFMFMSLCVCSVTSPLSLTLSLCVCSVIATMRDLKRKDKLVEAAGDVYGQTLSLLSLDVCSDESVKQCVDSIKDRHIDILSEFTHTHTHTHTH